MNTENKSIGVFIDGGYYAKINEALQDNLSTNVSISGLFSFIRSEVARRHGLSLDECFITEAHYFRGRYRAHDANNKHLLFSERKFEDTLIENDVIFHYKHLREIQKDGQTTIIEKGIDGEAPGSTLSESGSFAARAAERHGTATAPEPPAERICQ